MDAALMQVLLNSRQTESMESSKLSEMAAHRAVNKEEEVARLAGDLRYTTLAAQGEAMKLPVS